MNQILEIKNAKYGKNRRLRKQRTMNSWIMTVIGRSVLTMLSGPFKLEFTKTFFNELSAFIN